MAIKKNAAHAASAWQTSVNPLRGITSRQIDQLLDQARRGNETRLQEAYVEMEKTMPIMVVSIQRRTGGLLAKDWKIAVRSAQRMKGFDENLAKEQAAYLEMVYGDSEERGLHAAIQHMAMAMFRGYSALKPDYGADGDTLSFELLDNWNLCRDAKGNFYWNPDADTTKIAGDEGILAIPEGEIVGLNFPYPIDMPGMQIYLRQLIGEEQWARATEKYGVAQVILTAPQGIGDDKIGEYAQRAMNIFEGGSGAIGYGSTVNQLSDARGQDPFSTFVDHQTKLILMMATGGTLGSMADATGLGSGVADSQNETFELLLRQDAQLISGAFNRTITKKLLDAKWPGKKHLAYFDFNLDSQPSALDILELAAKAKSAGFIMDAEELSAKIGFTLTVDTSMEPVAVNALGLQAEDDNEGDDDDGDNDDDKDDDKATEDKARVVVSEEPASAPAEPTVLPKPAPDKEDLAGQLALAFGAKFLPLVDEFEQLSILSGEAQVKQAKRILGILDTMDIDDADPMVTIIHEIMTSTFTKESGK